jgi:hypothetical protein
MSKWLRPREATLYDSEGTNNEVITAPMHQYYLPMRVHHCFLYTMPRYNTEVTGSGEACKPFIYLADCQGKYDYRVIIAAKAVAKWLSGFWRI